MAQATKPSVETIPVRKTLKAASLLLFMISVCRGNPRCRESFYPVGPKCCKKCPPGQFVRADCWDESTTLCSPCNEGTFSVSLNQHKNCPICTNCVSEFSLRIFSLCTSTQDTVCEPLDGFFCRKYEGKSCEAAEKHSVCEPGQYIRRHGTSSTDTQCSDCRDGTFSDGTFSSCQPHTQCRRENLLLSAGTASADAECSFISGNFIVGLVAAFLCVALIVVLIFNKWPSGKCLQTKVRLLLSFGRRVYNS